MDNVKGLIVFVNGAELVAMSTKAVVYHQERTKFYREQAAQYRKMAEEAKTMQAQAVSAAGLGNKMAYSTNNHGDPEETAENSALYHERRMKLHSFLETHWAKERTYELNLGDLEFFGLSKN